MEFYQNPDEYLHEVGDLWRVGTALEANNSRNFMIAANYVAEYTPFLRFTPNGVLSLGPDCVVDAPTIRQNGTTLDSRFMRKSEDESAAGNKTFTGLTRLEGGVHTRRNIVSNTTTVSNSVLGGPTAIR